MLMNFCIISTPRCQIFIWECEVRSFACFSKLLPVKRVKVKFWKNRKFQLLSIFRCQDIAKNVLHSKIMFLPQLAAGLKVTWETNLFFKFWIVMYK